jgi:hypothetical protein
MKNDVLELWSASSTMRSQNLLSFIVHSKSLLTWIALLCLPALSFAQDTAGLRGEVKDSITGEALPGARIELRELHRGAIADTHGNYTIENLPAGMLRTEVHSPILIGWHGEEALRIDPDLEPVARPRRFRATLKRSTR